MVLRGETVSDGGVSLCRMCLLGRQCLYVLAICDTALILPSNIAVGTK